MADKHTDLKMYRVSHKICYFWKPEYIPISRTICPRKETSINFGFFFLAWMNMMWSTAMFGFSKITVYFATPFNWRLCGSFNYFALKPLQSEVIIYRLMIYWQLSSVSFGSTIGVYSIQFIHLVPSDITRPSEYKCTVVIALSSLHVLAHPWISSTYHKCRFWSNLRMLPLVVMSQGRQIRAWPLGIKNWCPPTTIFLLPQIRRRTIVQSITFCSLANWLSMLWRRG